MCFQLIPPRYKRQYRGVDGRKDGKDHPQYGRREKRRCHLGPVHSFAHRKYEDENRQNKYRPGGIKPARKRPKRSTLPHYRKKNNICTQSNPDDNVLVLSVPAFVPTGSWSAPLQFPPCLHLLENGQAGLLPAAFIDLLAAVLDNSSRLAGFKQAPQCLVLVTGLPSFRSPVWQGCHSGEESESGAAHPKAIRGLPKPVHAALSRRRHNGANAARGIWAVVVDLQVAVLAIADQRLPVR